MAISWKLRGLYGVYLKVHVEGKCQKAKREWIVAISWKLQGLHGWLMDERGKLSKKIKILPHGPHNYHINPITTTQTITAERSQRPISRKLSGSSYRMAPCEGVTAAYDVVVTNRYTSKQFSLLVM